MMVRDSNTPGIRFGIGEIYGRSFIDISGDERRNVARSDIVSAPKSMPCPPRSNGDRKIACSKKGGICSLRAYERLGDTETAIALEGPGGRLRTTCPHRFEEGGLIYSWIGAVLLSDQAPIVLGQIGFLEPVRTEPNGASKRGADVGRIDNVLVSQISEDRIDWCALEKQAVYFQGKQMGSEWPLIRSTRGDDIPFPKEKRQPDYRSSGPKRLMPQLQIKVPTLRRWGKKMAVVVDEDFFEALGPMEAVVDVSNCDIAWFVVGYDRVGQDYRLAKRHCVFTTLERAVEGLTAGFPTTLSNFESNIRHKVKLAFPSR